MGKNSEDSRIGIDAQRELQRRTWGATLGIVFSRISGILRSVVVNAIFGPGVALDAYNVAMRFPTVLRDLFAEGALSAAFTKALVDARAQGPEHEKQVTALVVTVFGIVTLFLALLCVYFAKPLIMAVTASSVGQNQSLTIICFQILIFYLPIAMVSSVAMSLLGVRGKTFRATLASLFFNVGAIFGALVMAPVVSRFGYDPVVGLAIGTLLGGSLQFSYQLKPLLSEGLFRSFRFRLDATGNPLKEMLLLMFPRMLGQGAFSIALFVNTHYATSAGVGAISYITNAQNIILVPVGLFGVAGGFASLPLLTESFQQKNSEKYWRLLGTSCLNNAWMSALSVIGLALLAVPLCQVLLQHGKVTPHDTMMNALAVTAYCGSILFNSMNKILIQGFYALGDTRQILINSVCYLAINASLSSWLAPKYGVLGLGLSNCAASAIDLSLNLIFLPKRARRQGLPLEGAFLSSWQPFRLTTLFATSFAAIIFAVAVVHPYFLTHQGLYLSTFFWGALCLSGGGLLVVMLWLFALRYFGPSSLYAVFSRQLSRFRSR